MSGEQLDGGDEGNQYVEEASELGWVPLEKFKGDPEKWVDAETFVERGQQIMPILKKNNERLRTDLLKRDNEIGTLRNTLSAMQGTLGRLETLHNEGVQRALKEQKAALTRQLVEARREDDVDEEIRVQEALDLTNTQIAEAAKPVAKPEVQTPTDSGLSPDFIKWKNDNPWFGEDKKKTKLILRAAEDLREEGETLVGAEFMDLAAERAFKEESTPGNSKVEGGNPRGTSTTVVRSKGYASLPKEAQQTCMEDVDNLVGPNKKFKKVEEWQSYYAKLYYGEQV